MGTEIKPNSTTFERCPKDEKHPFNRLSANLYTLNGYQFAIMAYILSNKDDWNIVKYEIGKRLGFPERKFLKAWKELENLGHIQMKREWGCYHYTIYENPDYTTCTGADCVTHTTGSSTSCTGAILTTTNNNYYKGNVTITADSDCYELQFNELIALYPSVGSKPDGTTYHLSGKRKDCKKAYIDYLKTNEMSHDEIMTALKVELRDKQLTGRTNYQPGLLRWIEDRTFELYRGRSLASAKVGYGETFE